MGKHGEFVNHAKTREKDGLSYGQNSLMLTIKDIAIFAIILSNVFFKSECVCLVRISCELLQKKRGNMRSDRGGKQGKRREFENKI